MVTLNPSSTETPTPAANDAKRDPAPKDANDEQNQDRSPTIVEVADASATYGERLVALTASVTAQNPLAGAVSAGTVKFVIGNGSKVIAMAGSNRISNGLATATLSLSGVTAGRYSIQASYEAQGGRFLPGGEPSSGVLTVQLAPTTTRLRLSRTETSDGHHEIFTAVVTNELTGTPTGTVRFFAGEETRPVASAMLTPVDGEMIATYTAPALVEGVTITAVYDGDDNFEASRSESPVSRAAEPVVRRPESADAVHGETNGDSKRLDLTSITN
jgi:Big-like domain-containing protein